MPITCDAARELLAEALQDRSTTIPSLSQLILAMMEIYPDVQIQKALGIKDSFTMRAMLAYNMALSLYNSEQP